MFRRSALRKVLTKHTNAMQNNQIKQVKSKNEINCVKNISVQAEKPQNDNDEAETQRVEEMDKFNNKNLKLTTDDEDMDFHVIAADDKTMQPDYHNLDTFHRAVFPIMFLAQIFACMPVTGVWQPNPRRVRFSFISPQMFITLLFMATSSVLSLGMLKHLLIIGVSAKNFVGLVFFFCVQTSCLLFVVLARRWPRLIRFWTRIELVFTQPPYETAKRNLAKRVKMSALIIISLFCIEHALYLTSAVLTYNRKARICAPVYNISAEISLGHYVEQNYDYVFQIVPFSRFMAFFVLIVNGTCTFIWNYMDLFIMMVSKGFSYRFEQITNRIKSLEHKEVQESTFVEIREHYVKLCELLDRVDEDLSNIILLSSINNLYFVCAQLLNIFNKLRWPINYIYFWYSLLYLIGRTAFVFLTAAAINDESVGALSVLRRVSNRTWCIEIERLIFQMSTQTVALSGKKFYFLTRRLLFGMAGTIVTYELVLLQFDEPNRVMGLGPLCA